MLLLLHVVAGSAALVLGPLALAGVPRAVAPYRALVLVVAASALALAGGSDLPGSVRLLLAGVALGSAAAALLATERALRGSFVALVAAVAFVSWPVWTGVLVVAVGSAAVHALPVRQVATGTPVIAGRRGSNSSIG